MPLDDLMQAADLIDRQAAGLNLARAVCPACGMARYENFAEYQLARELAALATRLRKYSIAGKGRKKPPKPITGSAEWTPSTGSYCRPSST